MTDFFQNFKNMFNFNSLQQVDNQTIFPLTKWLSNEATNLPICMPLNKYAFWMDKDVYKYALHFGINKSKRFISTLKKLADKDEKTKLIKSCMQRYYKWSDREVEIHSDMIELIVDEEQLNEWNKMYGLNKKECKVLGLEYKEPKLKKLKVEKTKTIGGWF